MEHSRYYTEIAVEKTAGMAGFITHFALKGLRELDSNVTRNKLYNLADTLNLLKHGRVSEALRNVKSTGKHKRAGLNPTQKPTNKALYAAIGGGALLGAGLGIRSVMPSRYARLYINDANARVKAYNKQQEKKNDSRIK